jgi:hypothetical protein
MFDVEHADKTLDTHEGLLFKMTCTRRTIVAMVLEYSTEQLLSTLIEVCFARRRGWERVVTVVAPDCSDRQNSARRSTSCL